MKQLVTVLLLFASLSLGAQSREVASLQKNYGKAKTDTQDAKKGNNASTWIKYAKILMDAYDQPVKNLMPGLTALEAKLMLKDEKPISSEVQKIQGDDHEVVVYEDKTLYYNSEGKLNFWKVTKPVLDVDMLVEAYNALSKALELDTRGSNKKNIAEQMENLRGKFLNEAMAQYSLGDFANSSRLFAESIKCGQSPVLGTLDTTVLYYAGLTAHMGKDYDRSAEFFRQCIDLGYTSKGDVYANLAECYKAKGEIDKAKEVLAEGFTSHPDAQSILVNLINIYLESNDNPEKVLEFIHKAQSNEPNNASLYYAEGNVYKNLEKVDEAIACYQKSVEMNPNYYFGYLNMGVTWYENAFNLQTKAADEMDDAKYSVLIEQMDKSLENAVVPFEKCLEICNEEDVKAYCVEYLKNIFFRLRTKNADYEAKYEQYNNMKKAE